MAKLQASYDTVVQRRDEAKKELAKVLYEKQLIEWEVEHQDGKREDYEREVDKTQIEIATLNSHLPMLSKIFSCFLRFYWLL